MFPLFHLGLPIGLSEIPYIRKRFKFNRLSLSIGALIPDLIDKLLLFTRIGSGRYISHTLLFLFGSSLILLLFSYLLQYIKKSDNEKYTCIVPFSYFIGILIHITLDLPKIPLLYPFIAYKFVIIDEPITHWVVVLFTDPIVIITELIGLIIIIIIFFKNKLYYPKKMWHYLILTQ